MLMSVGLSVGVHYAFYQFMKVIELTQLMDWSIQWCWSIIDTLINPWIDQSMDWSIYGLINPRIDNFFQKLYFFYFFNFFKNFCIFFNFFSWTLELSIALYSSRTLWMQKKYLLSIEGSILSWWKGKVDGALDPWSCLLSLSCYQH